MGPSPAPDKDEMTRARGLRSRKGTLLFLTNASARIDLQVADTNLSGNQVAEKRGWWMSSSSSRTVDPIDPAHKKVACGLFRNRPPIAVVCVCQRRHLKRGALTLSRRIFEFNAPLSLSTSDAFSFLDQRKIGAAVKRNFIHKAALFDEQIGHLAPAEKMRPLPILAADDDE